MEIKLLVIDVDGTLTDGKLYYNNDGECFKVFNAKDGYGIKNLLPLNNIIPVIITVRQSKIVKLRADELNVCELFQGNDDKLKILNQVMDKYGCTYDEVAYIGDDIPDLECIERCAVTGCPADASLKIKEKCNYICVASGGNGAVREFIEWIIS